MSEEFDLHAALTGRKHPEAKVPVWLDDEPWYELQALERRHAALGDPERDAKELKEIEAAIDRTRETIEATKWIVQVRGISKGKGNDLITEALVEIPVMRDMYGRDDFKRERDRNALIQELSFAEHITEVVNPDGKVVTVTDENRRDVARLFLREAPDTAIDIIDNAIAQVSSKFAELQTRHQSPDFL